MKVQRLVHAFLFCIAAVVTGMAQAPAQAGTATTSLSPLEQAMQGDAWKLKFQQTTPTHWGDW